MNPFKLLLELKWLMAINAFRTLFKRSKVEGIALISFFILGGFGLFVFFYQSFLFFKGQEPFGPILIDETFYLFNFALFTMLFISTAVSTYASLFNSKEVTFLLTQPVGWSDIYATKVMEAVWLSSWAFLFAACPFMTAYGLIKNAGLFPFPFLCLAFYLPLVLFAGILGSLSSIFIVWLLPSRGRRRMALILSIIAITIFFAKTQPEAIKEQGSIAGIMSGYLPQIGLAKGSFLPSYWLTRGILALSTLENRELLNWRDGVFYGLVLFSNVLFFMIPSAWAGSKLFPETFFRSRDHGQTQKRNHTTLKKTLFDRIMDALPWPSKPALAFLEKDIKTFRRDASEWSQLLVFFGLLIFYFANLKNLQFHILKDFWKNIIFVLNTVGTYIVLSSFSMRFVFPMLSLEGSKSWILGISPIRYSTLLLEKFSLGVFVSCVLTLPLIYLSGWMLDIEAQRILLTTGLGFFVCLALTGLSVGFGAKFPNFKSTNPAEIISGLGGSMLLFFHITYLALVGLFLLKARGNSGMILGVFLAAGSLLVAMIPIWIGKRHLENLEY